MSTTTIAATQDYELHDIALVSPASHNPMASSRPSSEIRPAGRGCHIPEQSSTTEVDIQRILKEGLPDFAITKKRRARARLIILQVSIIKF